MARCPTCGGVLVDDHCPHCVVADEQSQSATKSDSAARAVVAMPDVLAAGAQVGEYTIIEQIGRGGMAQVYSAVQPLIDRKVAIKVLSPQLARDPVIVRRFVQEARAVNRIKHPNIVDIYSFGQLPDGRQYFVMELLTGVTLRRRLESAELYMGEVMGWLVSVCEALEAAHDAGIVHRDLKPDNVFLSNQRAKTVVKLLDFGIAKVLADDHNTSDGVTRVGAYIGTPSYMSPEQVLGRTVDQRTDVYALGLLLYQCVTMAKPFGNLTGFKLMEAHVNQKPDPPGRLVELPGELNRLIMRCLEKDPARRPADVTEVKVVLRGFVSAELGLLGAAPVPRLNYRRIGLVVGGVFLAALTGALVVRRWNGHGPVGRPPTPQTPMVHVQFHAKAEPSPETPATPVVPEASPEAPEAPATPIQQVHLTVVSHPEGATVYLEEDGSELGVTPLSLQRPRQDGKTFAFIVRRSGYEDARAMLPLGHDGVRDVQLVRVPAKHPRGHAGSAPAEDVPLNPFQR
jgi:tRNA A-37 threonylcarbamoyl transferase component Bud32